MTFAAVKPFIETFIVKPDESAMRGREYVSWGENNRYPEYLLDLYENCATLHSIVDGLADFVAGDDVICNIPEFAEAMNGAGESPRALVYRLAKGYSIWGGLCGEIIRNNGGGVAEVYSTPMNYVRSNKDNNVFFYSEKWKNGYIKESDIDIYPGFIPGIQTSASQSHTMFLVKNELTRVYPSPMYAAAVMACELERSIDIFHLNSINHGFFGSYLINFNQGTPTDDQKHQVERAIQEKFGGKENAGRIMLSWNDSIQNRTTLEKLDAQDFGEKYRTLAEHSRQQIFTAFRATPNLFGLPTETTGFSEQEFSESFKIYNRTVVTPIQRMITDLFDHIFGVKGAITIKPFSIQGEAEDNIQ